MTNFAKRLFLLTALVIGFSGVVNCVCDRTVAGDRLTYHGAGKNARDAKVLPTIAVSDLPAQARYTLKLIKQGGPFPYRKDGTTFKNREKRLPIRPRDYYKEYTVKTPGVRSRGARRIIAGSRGEFYFTGDHYKTFKLIME